MSGHAERRVVVVERAFAHPPAKLWQALTQPHLIETWLMRNDFVPQVGHHFSLSADWGGVIACKVLVIEPDATLSYRWNFEHSDPALTLHSVVTFTLTPTAEGTLLRMEQAGFGAGQARAFGGARAGWTQFLARLDAALS